MGDDVIRIGTRRSTMAMTQTGAIAERLERLGYRTELVEITTEGDVNRGPLAQMGGTGVFAAALREALLAGTVDAAVHSLKDLPTTPLPGVSLAAVPERDDPRDVLVGRTSDGEPATLDQLPANARVGTGSPRRGAQVRLLRDDVNIVDIRGNVDTRLGKVTSGTVDAVVLARAGLHRLGLLETITQTFATSDLLPAPGQGALAVECRAEDEVLVKTLAQLDDPRSRAAVTAERAVLARLEAGCAAPVGAYAEIVAGEVEQQLQLTGVAISTDASHSVRLSVSGPLGDAERLGHDLGTDMLAGGASRMIEERLT